MLRLKITTIGSSVGVILPKEALARLKVGKGDQIALTEVPGGYEITSYDPDFETALDASRKIAKRYRNALRQLAK